MKYPIGTKFKTSVKSTAIHTIVDFFKTYNLAGELIYEKYITVHTLLGHPITQHIQESTIDVSVILEGGN